MFISIVPVSPPDATHWVELYVPEESLFDESSDGVSGADGCGAGVAGVLGVVVCEFDCELDCDPLPLELCEEFPCDDVVPRLPELEEDVPELLVAVEPVESDVED